MAIKGSAELILTLTDKGTIAITQKKIDGLAASTERLTTAGKGARKGSNEFKRNLEGVSGRVNQGTKDFAKMSQGMGGLVQAYATVAANVFALSTAFNVLSAATNFQDMISSARNLSAELGTSFLTTADAIQKATKSQIDFRTALRAANKASASGISAENVTKFAEAAAKSAQTFGGTTTDALNRMVTAILQGETELLKEVGIVISSLEAFRDYGREVGKAANQLTSFEKRQALSNAVLKESERLFAGTEIQVNNYEVLAANLQDAAQQALNFVNNTLGVSDVIGAISESMPLMAAGTALFAQSIISKLVPSIDSVVSRAKEAGINASKLAKEAVAKRVAAERAAGTAQAKAAAEGQAKLLAQAKKALAARIMLLEKEGKLSAAALRKGSTLRKARDGEDFSQRGVNALDRGKTLGRLPEVESKALRDSIAAVTAEKVKATAANKALADSNARVNKSVVSLKLNFKLAKQQLIASNQSTKAAILLNTQGASAFDFYGRAVTAANRQLAVMAINAKRAGVALTFVQKAGNRAALAMSVLSKATSSLFKGAIALTIAWETFKFVLDAVGLKLFETSKANEDLASGVEDMQSAFLETTKTLNGMIDAFERLDGISDQDLIFQKKSIARGNVLKEIGVQNARAAAEALKGQSVKNDLLERQIALERKISEDQKARNLAITKNNASNKIATSKGIAPTSLATASPTLFSTEGILASRSFKSELKEVNTALEENVLSMQDLFIAASKGFGNIATNTKKFAAFNKDFGLTEQLRKGKAVTDILGDTGAAGLDAVQIIEAVDKATDKLGSADKAKALEALGDLFSKVIGEKALSAGNSVKELTRSLEIFQGENTAANKTVFKGEGLASYNKLIEQALSSTTNLKDEGVINFADFLGINVGEVRARVLEIERIILDAGKGTLDRASENNISSSLVKRSITESKINNDYTVRLANLQQEEILTDNILKNKIETVRAELALQQVAADGGNEASGRRVGELKTELVTLGKILTLQELKLRSARFENKERAKGRQNDRELSNLGIQQLNSLSKLSVISGNINATLAIRTKVENASLARKKQDLDFDTAGLEAKLKVLDISKQDFDRGTALLAQRKEILKIQEEELRLKQLLRGGEETFKATNSTNTGAGVILDSQELFDAFMVQGANKFLKQITDNNPLKTLSDGLLSAMDNAIDSLVSTIGTGDDDLKGILAAVNQTLHTAILEATSTAIKQELSKLLFGNTLSDLADQAQIEATGYLATMAANAGYYSGPERGSNGGIFGEVGDWIGGLFGGGGAGTGTASIAGAAQQATINAAANASIPGFANGGVVNKPTLSMIGEGKNSEAVVPLPNNREIPVRIEGGGGGSNVVQNFDFSGADAQTESRLRGYVDSSRVSAFNDVFGAINRGGKYAKMSGRRR